MYLIRIEKKSQLFYFIDLFLLFYFIIIINIMQYNIMKKNRD